MSSIDLFEIEEEYIKKNEEEEYTTDEFGCLKRKGIFDMICVCPECKRKN